MTAINVSGARRTDRFPNVTGRDNYILMQALGYAIEAIGRLPERWQERSNREDMIELLAAMSDNRRKAEGVEPRAHIPGREQLR